jgi:hypothetical protein
MKNLILLVWGLVMIGFTSCNSNDKAPTTNCLTEKAVGKLLIGNEGNFNWGVGTLSLYDSVSQATVSDAFTCQNGEPAGNVVHSLYQHDDEIFVVVNNSRKVEVLNNETLKRKRTITNLNSPRNVIELGNKLFISDLYNNKISILGSSATQVERHISVFGWVEKLFPYSNNKFLAVRTFRMGVSTFASSAILSVNPENEIVTDSLLVPNAISDAHLEGNYLLLSTTDYNSTANDSLLVMDVTTNKIIARASLSVTRGRVSKITYLAKTKSIYYVKYDVHKIGWDAQNPTTIGEPTILLAKQQGQEFYSLACFINQSNTLYITDAKNYTSNGELLIYNLDQGKVVKQISAGIIPGSLLWIK